MTVRSLGKVTVSTAGTPVPLSPAPLWVWRVRVQAVIGETGKVYLMDDSGAVIKQFWPTGAGGGKADEIEITAPEGAGNVIDVTKLKLDAQTAGQGALVSVWVK